MAGGHRGREVVVVLGAAVWRGGVPSHALLRRTLHAVSLAQQDPRLDLLFTGGLGRFPPTEAVVMRKLALEAAISPDRLFVEERAASTWESAETCSALIRDHGWSAVTVVTDGYHLRRKRLAFRIFGVETRGEASRAPAGVSVSLRERWRERVASGWYRVRSGWARARSPASREAR